MSIVGPGTKDDLVADAHASGYDATRRLITDWVNLGLLDRPTHKARGRGKGSEKGLFAANQRKLFLTLLEKRAQGARHVRTLARVPIIMWCLFGDGYVPTRQALRAFKTWLGDAKSNRNRAKEMARQLVALHDHPSASADDRRELEQILTGVAYSGRIADQAQLERAVRQVFEPEDQYGQLHRAVGHPDVLLTAQTLPRLTKSRFVATHALQAGTVTEDDMRKVRLAFLFSRAAYLSHLDEYRAHAPDAMQSLFEPATFQSLADTCALDLLTLLGEAILNSEVGEIGPNN